MTERGTLGEVSHTNPYTGEVFGETQTYGRGRVVAADGGAAESAAEESDSDAEPDEKEDAASLKEVDHTPREGAPSANAAYDRDDGANDEDREADAE